MAAALMAHHPYLMTRMISNLYEHTTENNYHYGSRHIAGFPKVQWWGVCDGMTYEEIKVEMVEEYLARKQDKLRYRYPRGESYLDVIQRLEPVIIELERQRAPVVVIAHHAILRALYAYFTDK